MFQPIPYQLDTLGWMQFEYLIQVLLKAQFGIGVESWGGSADHGKDAYCNAELNFPSRHTTNTGPFVFQAKFVNGANAAGTEFEVDLSSAISKEAKLIAKRLEIGRWKSPPQQYALFTNAPVTASQRTKLTELLQQTLPTTVFVPTKAYDRAWTVLSKHNFVVLEGPPEMGKTAIAWMIAAVQLARKWEAIDCDTPNEFFKSFTDNREQVFIADDAFGITRGSESYCGLQQADKKLRSLSSP
jgi:hypothetical protein